MLTDNQVLKARDHFVGEVIRCGGADAAVAAVLKWQAGAGKVIVDEGEALARRCLDRNGLKSNPGESAAEALERLNAMSDAELVEHLITCGRL
ncbi:TPA: hypothetical protein QDA95_003892 [Burkholderia vietnamiensis]|nr:hypothetical protein [Burkholderia vietnamiensis]HDR8978793.1 hypothetical protein [Burkholderia vietnamiensis]